jgi:cell division protein FtsZ
VRKVASLLAEALKEKILTTDTTRKHYAATIKVVGLGRSGSAAAKRATASTLEKIEPILVYADGQLPAAPRGANSVETEPDKLIRMETDPTAQELKEKIQEALTGADMVVLIAGSSDEPELQIAPLVGEVAKEMGALLAAVVAHLSASSDREEGIQSLREAVDMLVMVPDDTLLPGFLTALRGE